jgi:hypothetical protein
MLTVQADLHANPCPAWLAAPAAAASQLVPHSGRGSRHVADASRLADPSSSGGGAVSLLLDLGKHSGRFGVVDARRLCALASAGALLHLQAGQREASENQQSLWQGGRLRCIAVPLAGSWSELATPLSLAR